MSGIPSLTGSLKKKQALVQEITSAVHKETTSLLTEINRLIQIAEHLREVWEDKQATATSLDQEITTLEGELSAEKREKAKLDETKESQERALADAKREREELEREIPEMKAQFETIEEQLLSVKKEIRVKETIVTNAQNEIKSVDNKFTDESKSIQEKIGESAEQAKTRNARYKALRFLINQQMISMPEAKVALELKGRDTTTLEFLTKTTLQGRIRVKEILEKLATQGVIEFNSASGHVKLLKPIDL